MILFYFSLEKGSLTKTCNQLTEPIFGNDVVSSVLLETKHIFVVIDLIRKHKAKEATMADRFFDNVMPDLVRETGNESGGDALMNLLAMPYSSLSQQLKRSAVDLKETVS